MLISPDVRPRPGYRRSATYNGRRIRFSWPGLSRMYFSIASASSQLFTYATSSARSSPSRSCDAGAAAGSCFGRSGGGDSNSTTFLTSSGEPSTVTTVPSRVMVAFAINPLPLLKPTKVDQILNGDAQARNDGSYILARCEVATIVRCPIAQCLDLGERCLRFSCEVPGRLRQGCRDEIAQLQEVTIGPFDGIPAAPPLKRLDNQNLDQLPNHDRTGVVPTALIAAVCLSRDNLEVPPNADHGEGNDLLRGRLRSVYVAESRNNGGLKHEVEALKRAKTGR
jgi:hypothetical protein